MEGEKQEGEAERKEEGKAVGMSSIISGGKSECSLNSKSVVLFCGFLQTANLLFPHRRCKLRVLDLRNTGQDFWKMWSGSSVHVSSSSSMTPMAEVRSRTEQPLAPLEVFIELHFKESIIDDFLIYLIRWVEQRKASIRLCSNKLKIASMSLENIVQVLGIVQLDCIQEVEVSCVWHLSTLAMFAPFLGQMSNIQRLHLSHIHGLAFEEEEEYHHAVQITSQFRRLYHLRDLYLETPSFLEGCLNQMLR